MNNKQNWKRVFAIIWAGQGISILSSSMVGYAIIFWISLETGSAETLAFAAIAGMLPQSLLGPLVGIYIDRWSRKRVMILADCFIALCTLILAILFWLDVAQMWHIYILLACRSVGTAFHSPAMQASVPLLAPKSQLTRVAGVNQMLHSFSYIAGPALGAVLLAATDLENILLLDVAGALIASVCLLFVHIPTPKRSTELAPSLRREFRESISAITETRGLKQLLCSEVLVMIFLMPISVLFPLMTLDHFGGGAYEMSVIEIVWGGGALVGGLVMSLRTYRINKIFLICSVNLIIGGTFAMSGLLPTSAFSLFVLLTTIAGIAGSIFNASFIAIVQRNIAPNVLGRVLSLFTGINMLPAMLGLLGTGFLAEHVGLDITFVVAGLAICLIGAVGFFSRSMRALGREPNND